MHVVHKALNSAMVAIASQNRPVTTIVFYTSREPTDVVNAVFLLGAFMCLHLGATPEEAFKPFDVLRDLLLPYRDATWEKSTFDLHLCDCWAGLRQAVASGFYDFKAFNQVSLGSVRVSRYALCNICVGFPRDVLMCTGTFG